MMIFEYFAVKKDWLTSNLFKSHCVDDLQLVTDLKFLI